MDWAGLHPDLARKLGRVLAAMSDLGFPMKGVEGFRTITRQQTLYAQGRTAPGLIVTRADGVAHLSMHQAQADGFGHAVDCCFVGASPWDGPWEAYGACGKALGLTWGGDFKGFPDRPHLELPL